MILGHTCSNHYCFVTLLGYIFSIARFEDFWFTKAVIVEIVLAVLACLEHFPTLIRPEISRIFCPIFFLITSLVNCVDSIVGFGCKN